MTKVEAIQKLCAHAQGSDDAALLRAVCIAAKVLSRAAIHRSRVHAARAAGRTGKEAAHA